MVLSKVVFTAELEGVGVRYRLLRAGSWRRLVVSSCLEESDLALSDPEEVARRYPPSALELEGRSFVPGRTLLGASITTLDAVLMPLSLCFRKDLPPDPDKNDLYEVLSGASSDQEYVVLDLDSKFKMDRKEPGFDPRVIAKSKFVKLLPTETTKNPADSLSASSLFNGFLEAWILHLKSGRTCIEVELLSGKRESVLLNELTAFKKLWKPEF